jgi:hypothetical protein
MYCCHMANGVPLPCPVDLLTAATAAVQSVVQVNQAGDFIYTSTSATPVDDSFTYEATGACTLQSASQQTGTHY